MSELSVEGAEAILRALTRLPDTRPDGLEAALDEICAPDWAWRGSHPLNEMTGSTAVAERVWRPLLDACPDLERRDLLVIRGSYEGRAMLATMGHYCGTFRRDWLGIPATGRAAFLRFGEVHEIEDGRIRRSTCLWDLLDLMRQAEVWPLGPSLGVETLWTGPITGDGLALEGRSQEVGAESLAQTLAMHATLGAYEDTTGAGREGLLAMPQKAHWHPRMMWYGPAGIGTARGLEGFVDHHQLPFRTAFPRRTGGGQWTEELKARHGGGHFVRLGDGPYSVTGGWPSVFATHLGGGFLGLGPTGRPVTMRVMDFYLHHEGLIRENWIPLDVIDLLRQMDVDVFARMRALMRRG